MTAHPSPVVKVPACFDELVQQVTSTVAGQTLGPSMADELNRRFPVDGEWFQKMQEVCRRGRSAGWLCAREAAGIRFGRPVKPGPQTHGFSVDVVEMDDIVGPHHAHPKGEIDLVMPDDDSAEFDGMHSGWKVYRAGSAHHPTVSGGKALVLYFLPDGAIEFTR